MSFRLAFLLLFVALFFGGQPASGQDNSSNDSNDSNDSNTSDSNDSNDSNTSASNDSNDSNTNDSSDSNDATVTTTTVTTTTAAVFTQTVTMSFTANENFTLNESAFVSSLDLDSNVEAEIVAKFEVTLKMDTNKTQAELSTYYGATVTFETRRLLGRSLSTEQTLKIVFDIDNENATDIKGKIANPDSSIGEVKEAAVYAVKVEIIVKTPAAADGSKPSSVVIPDESTMKQKLADTTGIQKSTITATVTTSDTSSGSGSGGDVDAKSYHMDAVSGLLVAMIGGLVVQFGQWA